MRCLTTRLGVIVQEQCGPKIFAAIEHLRSLSKQIRQHSDPSILDAKDQAVSRLTVAEAAEIAHAFSLFFHLVNLCEERERVRRLGVYGCHESGAPMSLRRTFIELKRHRVPPEAVTRLLDSMRIEPVLTAHPTEAKRRSVFNHILRIGQTLEGHCGETGAALEREIDPWIEALWLTDEVRERPVTPRIEIDNTQVYFDRSIYDLAGNFWKMFQDELTRAYPGIHNDIPFFRFGSWVGTDRDGNPNVTPESSLEAAEALRIGILRYYLRVCGQLLTLVSYPCRQPQLALKIQQDLRATTKRFPATGTLEDSDQPSELYRRKIRAMMWRLERTMERLDGAYEGPAEFIQDARLLEEMIEQQPSPRVAARGPRRLRVASQVFGFHSASLDFRQHSSVTRAAAEELIHAAGLAVEPQEARIRSIQQLLKAHDVPEPITLACQKAIRELEALKQIQKRCGDEASHRYILSMCASASDIWDLLLLGRKAGLIVRNPGNRLRSSFDAIPLFETYSDLIGCPKILDQLFSDPVYRGLLVSRGNFQEVMLGYSDSVKDSGYVAANWSLFQAQQGLEEIAGQYGIRLGLFHGKGGTIDRGGGMSYRSVQAQPHAAPGGRLRITEQGEVISLKYSNPAIARRNLEQLVSSVVDANLLHPRRIAKERLTDWRAYAHELAEASRDFYRNLVYETAEFPHYFFQATPIDLIDQLRLGSRPSRRYRSQELENLRAIPWVFAWTQSRHFLPSWYGAGFAFEEFVKNHPSRGVPLLREMYRGWPFFSVLVDNAEISLAKTDLYIAGRYAALVHPASLRDKMFGRIEEEYHRTVRYTLEIRESSRLLEQQPVLAESIRLRNPYVDPLNFLQLYFLERWRSNPKAAPPELLHLLQITVGGIAFGMKSTG
ncbi:MAG TPA: phosphoenolpyruvate carboxylase [Terriglobia bacterium]|nr:phosphoenolpyruvate carboxylase [Terriglobia bacterium]